MSRVILSLDGGGIRGAATTQFLSLVEEQLKKQYNTSIRDCVDFYAGTSTGSIIALALATTKLPISEINELYSYDNAKEIFSRYKGWFDVDGVNSPKYEGAGKTKMLKSNIGGFKIGDVPADKHVLAVTYGVEECKPQIIKSTKKMYRNMESYQAADASSAAPTYFPTKEVEIGKDDEQFWLVDGGVIANNPTMCAIAEAKRAWQGLSLDDMRVLSIGTGYRTRKVNGPASQRWGALQWFTEGHIIDMLSDERVVAYQAMTITKPGSYIRVNAEMQPQPGLESAPDDAMDDISKKNIKRLKEFGTFWFKQYGESVVELLMGKYRGASLDRIDPKTGKPIVAE